jgi:hypothetical protein
MLSLQLADFDLTTSYTNEFIVGGQCAQDAKEDPYDRNTGSVCCRKLQEGAPAS